MLLLPHLHEANYTENTGIIKKIHNNKLHIYKKTIINKEITCAGLVKV
jgi:hypothetical protein